MTTASLYRPPSPARKKSEENPNLPIPTTPPDYFQMTLAEIRELARQSSAKFTLKELLGKYSFFIHLSYGMLMQTHRRMFMRGSLPNLHAKTIHRRMFMRNSFPYLHAKTHYNRHMPNTPPCQTDCRTNLQTLIDEHANSLANLHTKVSTVFTHKPSL